MQSVKNLIALVKSDMFRYRGRTDIKTFLKLIIQENGFTATLIYRINRFFFLRRSRLIYISKTVYRLIADYHQFEMPYRCKIGPGLAVYHLKGLVISPKAVLGKNINLSHQVTIGAKPKNGTNVAPIFKDSIYIGPGAKIIGDVLVGSGVLIGANAVLTKNAEDNAVMVGIPAKAIRFSGSDEYCLNTDYESIIPDLPEAHHW